MKMKEELSQFLAQLDGLLGPIRNAAEQLLRADPEIGKYPPAKPGALFV